MAKAWNFRFPVRLRCGHLVSYSGSAPWPGEHVWCTRCDAEATVAVFYYDPACPTGWCGVIVGDGTTQLRCTLHKCHDGDKHYDEPWDTWFAERGPLRPGASGNAGLRP